MLFSKRLLSGTMVPLMVVFVCGAVAPGARPAFGEANGVIGSVSAVGTVQLRGIRMPAEGTLFAGDRIQTSGQAYVKVLLEGGPQLELGDDTDVRVGRDDSSVQVAMAAGRMAFFSSASSVPVTVSVASLRIEAPRGAAAEVAFLAPNRLSVTALQDTVTVTGQEGEEEEEIPSGQQRIINLDAEVEGPETPETAQAPEAESSSTGKWVAIGAAAGGGVGAVVFLVGRQRDSASPSRP